MDNSPSKDFEVNQSIYASSYSTPQTGEPLNPKVDEYADDEEQSPVDFFVLLKDSYLSQPRNKINFLIFGFGMLLPWNCIMAAMDFFSLKFPSYKPSFSLLVAVSAPLFITQLIVYFFLQYLPLQFKLTWTFGINAIVTALIVLIPLQVKNEATAYYWTLALCVIFGVSYGILQAQLYATAGPVATLTNNLMVGLGLSNLCVNAIRMVFLACIPDNLDLEAQLFFYVSAVYLLICTVCAYTFSKEYMEDQFCVSLLGSTSMKQRWNDTVMVYKINWKEAWSVCLCYWVQFMFFPGVMLTYQFTFIKDFSWFCITVITYASWADTLGRWLATKIDVVRKSWLFGVCLVRGGFFTACYMLTFEGIWPKIFGSQWFIIPMLGLFAASCGYLSTKAMTFGSDAQTINQGVAGTIMGIHLSLGITLGSTFAILFLS